MLGLSVSSSHGVAAESASVSEGCQKYIDPGPPEVLVACPLTRTSRSVTPTRTAGGRWQVTFTPEDRACRTRLRWPGDRLRRFFDRIDEAVIVDRGSVIARGLALTERRDVEVWIEGQQLRDDAFLSLHSRGQPLKVCAPAFRVVFRSRTGQRASPPPAGAVIKKPLGAPADKLQGGRPLPARPPVRVAPGTGEAEPERQSYSVSGLQAWSVAKTYGFQFTPSRVVCTNYRGNSVEKETRIFGNPDGVDTQIRSKNSYGWRIVNGAVVGGNMVVYPAARRCTVEFRMFNGRRLAPGWQVVEVDLNGSFRWVDQPGYGSRSLGFFIGVTWPDSFSGQSRNVTVRRLVLTGPPGQNWQQAFGAP